MEHTHTHTCIHAYMHAHTCVHTHTCAHAHTHARVHMHTQSPKIIISLTYCASHCLCMHGVVFPPLKYTWSCNSTLVDSQPTFIPKQLLTREALCSTNLILHWYTSFWGALVASLITLPSERSSANITH